MTNQQAVQNNQTIKGGVTMSNKAFGFQLVDSKEVVVASDRTKVVFPVQVRMTLEVNGKQQTVSYGYSRLGGRQPYVLVEGKAPVATNRADFIKRLRQFNIVNLSQVTKELGKIQFFAKDEFIVAKCKCCESGFVTAANVDYIQRNTEKLSEKLGRVITQFDLICYKCQGHEGAAPAPKPQTKKEEKPAIPAQAHAATCESCGKEIKSQKVVEYSVKTFGKVLCYQPCQKKHMKLEKETTPKQEEPANHGAPQTESKPEPKPVSQDSAPKPKLVINKGFLEEVMQLDVAPDSEIAKVQEVLITMGYERPVRASEASATHAEEDGKADDWCVICDKTIPLSEAWINDSFCPRCVLENSKLPDGDLLKLAHSNQDIAAAKMLLEGASAASPIEAAGGKVVEGEVALPLQEEACGDAELESSRSSEAPAQQTEAEQKTPEPQAGSNAMVDDEYATSVLKFMEEASRSFEESAIPPMPGDEGYIF